MGYVFEVSSLSIWKSGVDIIAVGKIGTSRYGGENLEFETFEWRYHLGSWSYSSGVLESSPVWTYRFLSIQTVTKALRLNEITVGMRVGKRRGERTESWGTTARRPADVEMGKVPKEEWPVNR